MNKIILKEAFSIRNNLKQLFIRPSDNYAFIDGCRAVAVYTSLFFTVFGFHNILLAKMFF